ncbi:hypothetical protein O9K51_07470 [Purpureocillium lavendulum]|uniref:Secreted protein n=1 Tax=Purpureocillium lavendulum TaxID=1247861 RepID=A0AB34FLQ0_9HYPO|nr:hypothetical protein O9K51_07470 [Purpureocillium lavendulum]
MTATITSAGLLLSSGIVRQRWVFAPCEALDRGCNSTLARMVEEQQRELRLSRAHTNPAVRQTQPSHKSTVVQWRNPQQQADVTDIHPTVSEKHERKTVSKLAIKVLLSALH